MISDETVWFILSPSPSDGEKPLQTPFRSAITGINTSISEDVMT